VSQCWALKSIHLIWCRYLGWRS